MGTPHHPFDTTLDRWNHSEVEARCARLVARDVQQRIREVRARFPQPAVGAPSATGPAHPTSRVTSDVQRRILEVRARFPRPAVGPSSVSQPACPTLRAPSGAPLVEQCDPPAPIPHPHPPVNNLQTAVDVARQNHLLILELYTRLGLTPLATDTPVTTQPTVSRVAPATPPRHLLSGLPPIVSPAIDAPTRAKMFSYTCQYCGDNDHWTKDCPDPHRFDARYFSTDELRKVLDDKLKAESPALSGPPKDEDNTIPVQAAPAQPEPEIPPTLSTPSLEENPPCTSDPLGATPLETLASN